MKVTAMPNQCWNGPGAYILQGQRLPGKARIITDILWQLQQQTPLSVVTECNNINPWANIVVINVKRNPQEYSTSRRQQQHSSVCHTDNFVTPSPNQIGILQDNKPHYAISQFLGPKSKKLYQQHQRRQTRIVSKYSPKHQKNRII
jgi:hypothetical protein